MKLIRQSTCLLNRSLEGSNPSTPIMNKTLRGIWNNCPYLSQEEMEKFWRQARAIAAQRGVKSVHYWTVVAKITKGMAQKVDEERRKQDEASWLAERQAKSRGDWD